SARSCPPHPDQCTSKASVLAGPRPATYLLRTTLVRGKRMASFTLTVNGRSHTVDVSPDTPLLWVLRDTLGLTGTKYGCGIGQCSACAVHIDGQATRSCRTNITAAANKQITTIEGLSPERTSAVQRAWIAEE